MPSTVCYSFGCLCFFFFVSCCDESVGRISFMSSTSSSVLLLCWSVSCAASAEKFCCYICKFHNACMQLSVSDFLAQLREQNFNISHISAHKLSWYFLSIFTIAQFSCVSEEKNWISHAQMAASDRQARIAQQTRNFFCHLNLRVSILLRKSPDHQLVASSEIRETQFSSSLNLMT